MLPFENIFFLSILFLPVFFNILFVLCLLAYLFFSSFFRDVKFYIILIGRQLGFSTLHLYEVQIDFKLYILFHVEKLKPSSSEDVCLTYRFTFTGNISIY